MKKIAIGVCERINGICTTMGCFNAYNQRTKYFEVYGEMPLELAAFFTCNKCTKGDYQDVEMIANNLLEAGVEIVHLGICVKKCEIDEMDRIKEIFESKGLKVVEGTH